ncbi:hypothetical protein BZM26_23110 [Paraburkholderia strydomiana]|nr:hypothetical protein BZM26_23110 [Paraburkholderia strydomiana]
MKGKKGILVAIWLLQVVNYVDRVVLGFAGPAMMQTLHLNPQTFGVILSAFAVGYLVSQMPGGWLADRFGTRVVLVVAPLFWALLTGLTGLFTGVAILVFVRFAFGVSEGLSNPAIYKLVGDTFDERERAQAVAWWATAIAAAPALSGPLVGTLLTSFGWKAVFVMLAAPAIAIAVLNAILLPKKAEVARAVGTTDEVRIPFRILAQQPALWLISGVFCFWNAAYWGLLGWMPSYLALERHIDLKSAGMLGGIPYVFGVIGLIVTGWLGRAPCSSNDLSFLAVSTCSAPFACSPPITATRFSCVSLACAVLRSASTAVLAHTAPLCWISRRKKPAPPTPGSWQPWA